MPRHTLEASEKPLQDIFCDKYVFKIPAYQRPYAWTTEQTSELLDDVLTACGDTNDVSERSPYFLGSIVLIKSPERREADVVDGQQRLTTLTILLATLRDIEGGGYGAALDSRIRLNGDMVTNTPDTYLLTPRERDETFFRNTIQKANATINLPPTASQSDSRRSIVGNAAYLREKLLELDSDQRRRLASFLIQRCYLVVVAASDQESAFRIFSVLNSRGLDLSPTDILKADIIGAIEIADRDRYTEIWEDLEDELGRARFVELFGHIRMIHRKQKMRGTLVAEFREFVPALSNPRNFVDVELRAYASAYDDILSQRIAVHTLADQINRHLKHLVRLDNFDWQPPAILMLAADRETPQRILVFFRDLERLAYGLFLLREDTTERIARYGRVIQAMEDGSAFDSGESPLQLTEEEKTRILETLNGPIYSIKRLRLPILLRLDEAISDQAADYDHSIITVEHVLPQNPSQGSTWIESFPDEQLRAHWVHRLGNLVLLSRRKNAQASNWDFSIKKDRYFSATAGVTNFALTNSVIHEGQWTIEVLERRQKQLVDRLSDVWRLT